MIEFIQLQITFPTQQEAEQVAAVLVDRHKAACAQITGQVKSFYIWKDKRETSEEYLLLAKIRRDCFAEVASVITGLHSYECPQIVALPILEISPDYRQWLEEQTDPRHF